MSTAVVDLGIAKDLNSIKELGFYQVLDAVNAPTDGHIFLQVTVSNVAGVNRAVQKAWDMDTGTEYTRVKTASGWLSWIASGTGGGDGGPYDPLGTADAAVADHVAASDPHTQYLNETRGDERYDAVGAADVAVATHVGDSDPHTQYLLETAAAAAYQPLDSDLTALAALTTTEYGRSLLELTDAAALRTSLGLGTAAESSTSDFDSAGTADAAIAAHVAELDPHTQYLLEATAAAAYQPLDSYLTDIAGLSPSNGNVIVYNSGTGHWESQAPSVGSSGVTVISSGNIGTSNTSNVVNTSLSGYEKVEIVAQGFGSASSTAYNLRASQNAGSSFLNISTEYLTSIATTVTGASGGAAATTASLSGANIAGNRTDMQLVIEIFNPGSSGSKFFTWKFFTFNSNSSPQITTGVGLITSTGALNRVALTTNVGNFNGGTYRVLGYQS